jgi:hypothetical protein
LRKDNKIQPGVFPLRIQGMVCLHRFVRVLTNTRTKVPRSKNFTSRVNRETFL